MVHAIEAYTSKHKKNPLSDALALQALKALHDNIRIVLQDGRNADAREAMLLGSLFAGMAFANAPVAAVHALAYPLGGKYRMAHGLSNAILLPSVMPYMLTGMRLSVGTAWLVIVAAEMLTGGVGIGFWVWDEWNNLNVAHIIIAIFVIGIVGLLLEWALMAVAKRFDYS